MNRSPGRSTTRAGGGPAAAQAGRRPTRRPACPQGDATEPSKSQWSTLKKQLKRRDHQIFVFKEYGTVPCNAETDATCLYLDFGFFLDMM